LKIKLRTRTGTRTEINTVFKKLELKLAHGTRIEIELKLWNLNITGVEYATN